MVWCSLDQAARNAANSKGPKPYSVAASDRLANAAPFRAMLTPRLGTGR